VVRGAAALLALSAFPAHSIGAAQELAFPSHEVRIVVTVSDGSATVREEYVLDRPLTLARASSTGPDRAVETRFEVLHRPCASVGPVSASIDNRTVTLRADQVSEAMWTSFRVGSPDALGGRGTICRLQYDVQTTGAEASVPIVMPAATLERAEGSRGADVLLAVAFRNPSRDGRVLIPQLLRTAPGQPQTGRFLAIPSFVAVRIPEAAGRSCRAETVATTGGLEWRFAVFVGTMATWVPFYLWWFGRRRWPRTS
jgi:hypothetical protein